MQDFKKLRVWKTAHELVLDVYKCTKGFPREEMFGLTAQLRRAAVSIPANIAEACGRKRGKEFERFLQFGTGSASETECLLLIARDLAYLKEADYRRLEVAVVDAKRMLAGLIATSTATHSGD